MTVREKCTKTEWALLGLAIVCMLVIAASNRYGVEPQHYQVETFGKEQAEEAAEKVNVNTATAEELQVLPNIGPELAGRIVDYRRAHGPFTKAEDLLEVKGIGEKTLASIRDYIIWEETP